MSESEMTINKIAATDKYFLVVNRAAGRSRIVTTGDFASGSNPYGIGYQDLESIAGGGSSTGWSVEVESIYRAAVEYAQRELYSRAM